MISSSTLFPRPKSLKVWSEVLLIAVQVGPLENKTPGIEPRLRPFLIDLRSWSFSEVSHFGYLGQTEGRV